MCGGRGSGHSPRKIVSRAAVLRPVREGTSPSSASPTSVSAFAEQIEPMVERDGNSPAIVIWGAAAAARAVAWGITDGASCLPCR
ncbi:hypothetical protein STENM36S_07554 [Streptomyces tendae]